MESLTKTGAKTSSPTNSVALPINNKTVLFGVIKRDKGHTTFDLQKIRNSLMRACAGLDEVAIDEILIEVQKNVYDGIESKEIEQALILGAVPFIEKDPQYDKVSTRLLLQKIYKEVLGHSTTDEKKTEALRTSFITRLTQGVDAKKIDPQLLSYDLVKLTESLKFERDELFGYLGLQTLYERYLLRNDGLRLESPQAFWMRVAMGLSIREENREEKTLEFYNQLSTLRFVSSTPTLFHSGLTRPQLSSCYLTTIEDDLINIFKSLGDNAQLSKWAGGVANDWTNIRATGSIVKTIDVSSQGVIPFLKIANDVTAAINRSGSRRGATVAYLETWHYDIEDFLDLRRNTGDDRRRTHDMNTANWVPDLFMKRVMNDEGWTLFSPNEVPELHHLYGKKFENKYVEYEEKARSGQIEFYKVIQAKDLWKKMLSRLFETGHPWITFKDPCNVRSPQDHVGVVHSSNLCTEITLNTTSEETAVCNLGSINLEKHVNNGILDKKLLTKTIRTALRMLDNVIDINFYPTVEAKNSNLRHRPIGLGLMGFQDALFKLDINFDAPEALTFADNIQEFISYHAIMASSELAKEHGAYQTYKGSKWDRGIFPMDTLDLLEEERGMKIEGSRAKTLDWTTLKEHVRQHGMRNSNVMAIAPTATISNIAGCFPCIEPIYKNIYVKANMSGEFTIVNKYLIADLKKINLWNDEIRAKIKYFDGNVEQIAEIPQRIKNKYKEAFDIDPEWLLKISAARGKWIDQSQSHNVFMKGVSGKKLDHIYTTAWKLGLKTTYYLRTLAASQIEKSTLDAKKFGYTQKRTYVATTAVQTKEEPMNGQACNIHDESCESCQ